VEDLREEGGLSREKDERENGGDVKLLKCPCHVPHQHPVRNLIV